MVIMKIVVKSPKVAERTFIRINQRYYKCTIPMIYNNSHPFHHNTLLILPKKKKKKKIQELDHSNPTLKFQHVV